MAGSERGAILRVHQPCRELPMRAAAIIAGAVIVSGLYLAIAATVGVSSTWMALGILAIAVVAAIGMVASPAPERSAPRA
jgi:hypothetical protein